MNRLFITLYLILASAFDIKSKKLPLPLIIIFVIFEIFFILFTKQSLFSPFGFIPGLIMFIISYISDNSFGYGDSFLLFSLGFTLSFYEVFYLLLLGLFFSAITGCLLLINKKNKKYKLPFVPFLLLAWVLLM